jgi:predicted transcriptional regulator
MVVGDFKIDNIIHEDTVKLWSDYKKEHQIDSPMWYYGYLKGLDKAYGIFIKDVVEYKNEVNAKKVLGEQFTIPQFFRYITNKQLYDLR